MTPDTWVSEETGSVPSQEGAQELPLARMNAMSNAFCPVARHHLAEVGGIGSKVL